MLLKQNVFNSISVRFELSISKITTLFADLCGTSQLKICLNRSILLRFIIVRIRPKNSVSTSLNPLLKSEHSFKLQIISKVNIHICAQPCTWKEITNYKKFQRLSLLQWSQETRHSTLLPWILSSLSRSGSVSYARASV